ncbi:hypothetical protein ACQJBY_067822 [Aegilops geniculata]
MAAVAAIGRLPLTYIASAPSRNPSPLLPRAPIFPHAPLLPPCDIQGQPPPRHRRSRGHWHPLAASPCPGGRAILFFINYGHGFELPRATTSPSGHLLQPRDAGFHHRFAIPGASPSLVAFPTASLPRWLPVTPSSTTVLTICPSCQSNQTMEPRVQTPPSTTTPTALEVPTTTCSPLMTTRSS